MLSDLIKQLKTLGLPVTYGAWMSGQAPTLPYLVVLDTGRDDLYADQSNYFKLQNYDVELYFDKKNPEIEETVESLLADSGFSFAVSEDIYIETERMFEKIYSIEIGEKN